MEKLIMVGRANKVFSVVEAIARRHPEMPLALYSREELREVIEEKFLGKEICPQCSVDRGVVRELIASADSACLTIADIIVGNCDKCKNALTINAEKVYNRKQTN